MPKRLTQHSQCARIARELVRAHGNWVGMLRLVNVSGSYNIHTRVDELRRLHGYRIENRTDLTVRPHISQYRMLLKKQRRGA
jgi:hypothetical protein